MNRRTTPFAIFPQLPGLGKPGLVVVAALLAMAGLSGCVNECPAERTLVWRDADLLAGLAESDGFYPVGMDDQLAVNGTAMPDPWRLVFVREFGDGWVIHLTAAMGAPRLLLNLDSASAAPPTAEEVSGFVSLLTGWTRSQAEAWVDQHPLSADASVPFDYPVNDPLTTNPYAPQNGFWRYVDAGRVRYEWTTPHYEVGSDEQHLAVAADGSAAWWGVVTGPKPEQTARDHAESLMRDHGLDRGPPANAAFSGASPC